MTSKFFPNKTALITLIAACFVVNVTMGVRQTFGLFSVVIQSKKKNSIYNFINSLKLFGIGQSWGGFESLALYQSHVIQRIYRKYLKPNHHIVRFHIGLEDSKDLIEDLGKAIKKIK